jgi:tetratricopeptide (TPR) repeat protein
MRPGMKIRKWAAMAALVFGTIAANDVAPTNAELETMYDKAFRAFDAANYVQALKELDTIDARKPDLAASQNLRGVIYMRQGLYDKAEAALLEAERLDPKFWNARFNLAEVPFLKKDWAEARKRFQDLLTTNAAELQGEATQLIQYKILLTYLFQGNDTMVDSILAKFELAPETPAVHYANAAIALQHQNIPDAKNWMTAAEKNFSPQLNKLFAESLFEVGWLEKSPGQQRAALQLLTPEERAAKAKAVLRSLFEQAQQAYEERDFANAARLAEQADAAEPNQPSILNLRGEILLEQQKFEDAETFFKKALKVDPKFREAQFNLADVPFRKKEYAKARDRFESLLRQTPGGDKNQASQLIKFNIFMTYLLEGKDSRAQKMMEQFQFSGDTPALYYAQAAWEFQHSKEDKANDWIASARKIYPLAANAAYGSGFYDLGWLKSAAAVSSPTPGAAVDAAAIASAQNESSGPAVEPSPIPGVEAKAGDESPAQFSVAQAAAPSPIPGVQAPSASSPSEPRASQAPANPIVTVGGSAARLAGTAGSPARPEDVPASSVGSSSTVENPPATPSVGTPASSPPVDLPAIAAPSASAAIASANAQPSPAQSSPPVAGPAQTPATVVAPAKVPAIAPTMGERLDRMTDPRTLLWMALLLGGIGALTWAILPSIRRRFVDAQVGRRPAPATGPELSDHEDSTNGTMVRAPRHLSGGPRQVSLQLKASEPSLRRAVIPLAKRPIEAPVVAEVEPTIDRSNGQEEFVPPSLSEFSESSVGPVIEQETESHDALQPSESVVSDRQSEFAPTSGAAATVSDEAASVVGEEQIEWVSEPIVQTESAPELVAQEPSTVAPIVSDEPASVIAEEQTEWVSEPSVQAEPVPEFVAQEFSIYEPIASEAAVEPAVFPEEIPLPEPFVESPTSEESEPVLQGQPVPYQTVVSTDEPVGISASEDIYQFTSEIAAETVGETPVDMAAGANVPQDDFASQPTTNENMPETLQTPTAPVIRTPAGGISPQSVHAAAPGSQAVPATGMQTAVQITLSCEIASMQLTPTFKMGALQLRPISKVVTMRLAPSQQPQPAMNLQVNFEIAKVQPAPNSLGQMRLNPSQQQKPATLTSPSFNIAGLQIVSGFEGAPVQLTPTQQGQASVHVTAAFQITTVEFSPSFDISAIILNSSSKTVSVQLPGAGATALENAPVFEITNVQLASSGEIAMLQLNPVGPRRG